MALITLAEAKAHAKIAVATYDADLQPYVDGVATIVEGKIEGPALARAVVEEADLCDSGRAIALRQRGFVSLTGITANGVVVSTSDVVVSGTRRVLRRRGGLVFSPTTQPMLVTYQAGYDAASPELAALKMAAKIIVAHTWETQRGRAGGRGPSANSEMGSINTVVPGLAYAVPNRALEWLAPFMPETGLA